MQGVVRRQWYSLAKLNASCSRPSPTSVFASEEAPNFEDFDANGNGSGSVDMAEFAKGKNSAVEKTFAEVDVNKDSKISGTEYEVIKEPECD